MTISADDKEIEEWFQRCLLHNANVHYSETILYLQQALLLTGRALRMTVVSLTLSSCSINTLSQDTDRIQSKSFFLDSHYHFADRPDSQPSSYLARCVRDSVTFLVV